MQKTPNNKGPVCSMPKPANRKSEDVIPNYDPFVGNYFSIAHGKEDIVFEPGSERNVYGWSAGNAPYLRQVRRIFVIWILCITDIR